MAIRIMTKIVSVRVKLSTGAQVDIYPNGWKSHEGVVSLLDNEEIDRFRRHFTATVGSWGYRG